MWFVLSVYVSIRSRIRVFIKACWGMRCVYVCFFFFQAADGIRYLVLSRGLGDLYKIQSYYSALRELGVNNDLISVDADFSGYRLIIAPSLPIVDQAFVDNCRACDGQFIFLPRAGAKTS